MIGEQQVEVLSHCCETRDEGEEEKVMDMYWLEVTDDELAYRTAFAFKKPKRSNYFAEDEDEYSRDMKAWERARYEVMTDWMAFFGIESDRERREAFFMPTGDNVYVAKIVRYRREWSYEED